MIGLSLDPALGGRIAPPNEDGCWLWLGSIQSNGYPRLKRGGRQFGAHRLVYEAFKGPIPEGLVIDHLCRVPACVNPDHLEAVTMRENTLRGVSIIADLAKRTHCTHGHPLSGDNLWIRKDGSRICRACRRRIYNAWKQKHDRS